MNSIFSISALQMPASCLIFQEFGFERISEMGPEDNNKRQDTVIIKIGFYDNMNVEFRKVKSIKFIEKCKIVAVKINEDPKQMMRNHR
jgi:hypothetical protein